ncbi:MAG: nucleotidyltransferase domain-containing protein [Deinococcota bacterium]
MSSSIDLEPRHRNQAITILQEHAAGASVWVFGSRTTGRARPFSDLDLVVQADAPLSLTQQTTLANAFEDSDLPFKVDVLDWHMLTPKFQRVIIDQCVHFWGEEVGLEPSQL